MRDLITYLVEGITGTKDFKVEEKLENDVVSFNIHLKKPTIAIVIGRSGKTIRMIRNLVKVRATLEGKLVNVSVAESD